MKKAIMSVLTVWILVNVGLFNLIFLSPELEMQVSATIIIVDVDGTPGVDCNYTTIQEGIDAANPGDTVLVKNGTYYERVLVNKTINLTGEDRDNTIIDGGGNGDVVSVTANGVTVSQVTTTKSGPSARGIFLDNVQDCKVINNTAVSNSWTGIYLYLSDGNEIIGNNVSKNNVGIYIRTSDGNNIHNNYVTGSLYQDIRLDSSIANIVTENIFKSHGFYILGAIVDFWNTHTIDTSNTVNGKPVHYWKDQTGGTIPPGAGQVILANCANVVVTDQNLSLATYGVQLGFSSFNTIDNCDFYYNRFGMRIADSGSNNITKNNFFNCAYGIKLDMDSDENYIHNNMFSDNNDGIWFYYADLNNITGNSFVGNGQGIYYNFDADNNDIIGNNFRQNGYGIRINSGSQSTGTLIYNNVFLKNTNGLYLPDGGNKIYHNSIMENDIQAHDGSDNGNQWDNGYPAGGNFWSDYNGTDLNSTPTQDVPPPDGIGDTPYIIDNNSQDNYPLISPIGNFTFLYEGWNLISIPFIQEDTNLDSVLSPINSSYDAVQWFNASDPSDPWKHHQISKPAHLNDLNNIEQRMAFWIHITNPGDTIFLYNGTQPITNQTIPLHPGWNMVGYPSLTNRNRTAALNNLTFGIEVDAVWTFNAATQTWEEIGVGDYFEVGRGYWIHAKQECVWEVPL